MRVLLISTYELGHQPLHVASPAAALRAAGHEVHSVDLSLQAWDPDELAWTDAVAFSVPMHTASRLALEAIRLARAQRADVPVGVYGLYAALVADALPAHPPDCVIAGEYELALVAWVNGLAGRAARSGPEVRLERMPFHLPQRDSLPALDRYAHLTVGGAHHTVGYVEASHGCVHMCRHCPVPSVYDGRIRVVGADVVLADVAQQVAMGAGHITFGDPDFLNGVGHGLRIVRALHDRHPHLTFDCTTKVEHILQHAEIWAEMAEAGCLFVVSAFETVNDDILSRLDKGHTAADASRAVDVLRSHGIEIRPSWLPFTPWTVPDDVLDILDFVAAHDMVENVDPVQYGIRLLLPKGSLLLAHPDLEPHLGHYDPAKLSYRWSSADARVDALQAEVAALVEARATADEPLGSTYLAVRELASAYASRARQTPVSAQTILAGSTQGRPRLTEPWFC